MTIRKKGNQYQLVSKKKDSEGKHKNLGVFPTLEAAKKHEREVEFFKHKGKDK